MLLLFIIFQYGHCYPEMINIADKDCLTKAQSSFILKAPLLYNQSCYLCLNCILEDKSKCTEIITPRIPAFNRILHGGFRIYSEKYNVTVNVTYSPTCVFQMQIYLVKDEPSVEFNLCDKDSCNLQMDKTIEFNEGGFLLYTFALPDNHVRTFIQIQSTYIELNDYKYNRNFTMECTDGKEMPFVELIFHYTDLSSNFHFMLVPCSPAGLLIDKETGKLFEGDKLEKYTNSTDRDGIAGKLGLDPNKTYPVPDKHSTLPIYITMNGSIKNEEDIKSFLNFGGDDSNEDPHYPVNLPAINVGGLGDYGGNYETGNENTDNNKAGSQSGKGGAKDSSSLAKKRGPNLFIVLLSEIFLFFVKTSKK